jgi:hypothetical protein
MNGVKTPVATGGCQCGKVRYALYVAPENSHVCHCRMCQRATGSISIAFKNVPKAEIEWESEPDWYVSSPIAQRPYCRECGTSLGFAFPDAEIMDLTIASFDDPSRFRPKHHFGIERMHRAWISTEGLPEYRTDQYEPLKERWIKAIGKLPDQT